MEKYTQKEKIAYLLRKIGVPTSLKGWRCLMAAIEECINDPDAIDCVTKVLYPNVAKQLDTTPSRVERAIRHAIEVAFLNADVSMLEGIFGAGTSLYSGKVTNSQFISTMVELITIEVHHPIWDDLRERL